MNVEFGSQYYLNENYESTHFLQSTFPRRGLSGVEAALWDIKAKRAGMPLYQLLGGKWRIGVPVYRHASGRTHEEVADRARQFISEGARYIRAQVSVPGQATYGAGTSASAPG